MKKSEGRVSGVKLAGIHCTVITRCPKTMVLNEGNVTILITYGGVFYVIRNEQIH